MPNKRKDTMSPPSLKRPRISYDDDEDDESSVASYGRPRHNPLYGQKSAFPGLDDGGDDLTYNDPDDGLEYLRMVRSEANSLPVLFSAPTQATDPSKLASNTQLDLKLLKPNNPPLPSGFYEDEAYIAPAEENANKAANSPSKLAELYPDAQNSYNNLLRHRFLLLRSTLRCSPPASAINSLDNDHPISLPRKAGSAHKIWRRLLITVEPRMVQLASMDMDSVLEVLEILARMISDVVRGDDTQRVRRIGAWAWGLLGRCREVGQLSTREVGVVRNLGKRAATILRKVQEIENEEYEDEDEADSSAAGAAKDETQQGDLVENEKDTEAEAQQRSTVQNEEATKQETQPEPTFQGREENKEEEFQPGPTVPNEVESKQAESPEIAEAQDSNIPDASSHEESDLEAAKARLQARLQTDSVQTNSNSVKTPGSWNEEEEDDDWSIQTHALLDMIITVVGEFFGQRDLLEEREIWE